MSTKTTLGASPIYDTVLDQGLSADARLIRERLDGYFSSMNNIVGTAAQHRAWEATLRSAFQLSAADDWDGHGGSRSDPSIFPYARIFLRCLPTSFPAPDIFPEPDGEIAFEWRGSPRNIFSVSVGRGGEINYAGLFGKANSYGREFLTDALPSSILEGLHRILVEKRKRHPDGA